jgi:hypothetical protein
MDQLTYESVQSEGGKRLVRYTFARGQGGPLALLWTLGTCLFVFLGNSPPYAAFWTLAIAVFASLIVRDTLRNPRARAIVSRELLEARFPVRGFAETRHRDAVQKAIDAFVEVLVKLHDIERVRGLHHDVADAVTEIDRLLALQCESARQVEELERILRFVGSRRQSSSADLHEENVAAVQREVAEAGALIELIGQRVETLLLQVYRAETSSVDAVTRAEGRRRSGEALDRLQHIVDARRAAASQLIELVDPNFSPELDLSSFVDRRPDTAVDTEVLPTSGEELISSIDQRRNGHAETRGEDFVQPLEEALRKLNSPAVLASCRLMSVLPHTLALAWEMEGKMPIAQPTPLEQAHALRGVLDEAIERLNAGTGTEPDRGHVRSNALHYKILREEYVQGLTTKAIMLRHSISESTFHRHRREAILILARELQGKEARLAPEPNGHRTVPEPVQLG